MLKRWLAARRLSAYARRAGDARRGATDPAAQVALRQLWRLAAESGGTRGMFAEAGFRVFSQTDEDGKLLFLFSVLGTTDKRCIEICAGDGIECNSANLLVNHSWTGLLVDGDPRSVERGRRFYRKHPATMICPPRFVHAWVRRDTVDELLRSHGFEGEIDLLALDLDGVDYWIWKAIACVTPRVVVVEYQNVLGPERSCTVPYADDFRAGDHPTTRGMPNFAGASLRAFAKLAAAKGYRLVGTNAQCFNAFFVRRGLGEELVPEVPVEACFGHPHAVQAMRERWPTVSALPWVEV